VLRFSRGNCSQSQSTTWLNLAKGDGRASITVTAHIYADLYGDELDLMAAVLDVLDDVSRTFYRDTAALAVCLACGSGPIEQAQNDLLWWSRLGSNQ
jgi:hypothetical protein